MIWSSFPLDLPSIYTNCKLADFKFSLNYGSENFINYYNNDGLQSASLQNWISTEFDGTWQSLLSCLVFYASGGCGGCFLLWGDCKVFYIWQDSLLSGLVKILKRRDVFQRLPSLTRRKKVPTTCKGSGNMSW